LLIMKTQQLQLESPVATSWVQLGCSFLQLLQLDLKRLIALLASPGVPLGTPDPKRQPHIPLGTGRRGYGVAAVVHCAFASASVVTSSLHPIK
jgi:hypothetical protein